MASEWDAFPKAQQSSAKSEWDAFPVRKSAPKESTVEEPKGDNANWLQNAALGAIKGASDIGATLLTPVAAGVNALGGNMLTGEQRRAAIGDVMGQVADPESAAFKTGEIGTSIAGTMGIGGPLGKALGMIPGLSRLGTAVTTMGGTAGTGGGKVANALTRMGGGAISGAGGAALINPEDAGLGAGIGAAVPVVGALAGKGAQGLGFLKDLVQGNAGKVSAGKIGRDAAGANLAAIRAQQAAAPADLTAAQAAYGIAQDPYQALGKFAQSIDNTSGYRLGAEAQDAARLGVLNKMARGESTEASNMSVKLMKERLELALGPERTALLERAAQSGKDLRRLLPQLGQEEAAYVSALQNQGRMATESAQALTLPSAIPPTRPQIVPGIGQTLPSGNFPLDPRVLPKGGVQGARVGAENIGMPRLSPQYTPNADRAAEFAGAAQDLGAVAAQRRASADALRGQVEAAGPTLTTSPIVQALESKLGSRMSRMNNDEQTVLTAVIDKLRIAGDDPFALYELRKMGINQVIGDLEKVGKLSKDRATAALMEVKPMIDDAFERAGATEWGQTMMKYSKGMEATDRVRLADELRQMYKTNPQGFMQVIAGEKPEVVQAIMSTKKGILDAVPSQTLAKLKAISAELGRDTNMGKQAEAGWGEFGRILKSDEGLPRLPSLINFVAAGANKAIASLEGKINSKTLDALREGMRSGASANEMLKVVPSSERNAVMRALVANQYNPKLGQAAVAASAQQ
jgi:hypothetical protein